jgi:DNA polymerase III epsilon subunit family exonuclease
VIASASIFVAFDTETTGLTAADGKIVEIAALKFNLAGDLLGEFSELANPGEPIPETAQRVHHIGDDMVADCPGIADVLSRFLRFIEGDEHILVAQNALFDIGFVNHEALRHDIKLPRNTILDQIELTRKAYPDLPTYSLENVCRKFDLVDTQTHRAMADAALVMRLFRHCLGRLGTVDEQMALLNNLYHYSFGGPMIVRTDEAMMEIIMRALETGEALEIIYAGGSFRGHPRLIIPHLLYNRDGVGYLTARCLNSNTNKQFRLDRIEECRPVDQSAM